MVTPSNLGVMVIDEDPTSLLLIHTMLKTCHYRVESFESPHNALNALREKRGLFDLVITEVHMDGVDGFGLLRHIVMQLGVPVITMCSDNDLNIHNRALIEGACFHLVKPINMNNMNVVWQKAWRKKEKTPLPLISTTVPAPVPMSIMNPFGLNFFIEQGQSSKGKKKSHKAKQLEEEEEEKKTRLLWERELHRRFLVAIRLLGDGTVPSAIWDLMNVEDLSIKQISSHLQKHRKRVNDPDEPSSVCRPKKYNRGRPRLSTSLPPGVAPLLGMTPMRINNNKAPLFPPVTISSITYPQKEHFLASACNSTYPQNSTFSNISSSTLLMGNASSHHTTASFTMPYPVESFDEDIGTSLPRGNVVPASYDYKNQEPAWHAVVAIDDQTTAEKEKVNVTSIQGPTFCAAEEWPDLEAFWGIGKQPATTENQEPESLIYVEELVGKKKKQEPELDPVKEWLNLDAFSEIPDEYPNQTVINEKPIVVIASADEWIDFDAFDLSIEKEPTAGKEMENAGEEEFLEDFAFSVEDCIVDDGDFGFL